MSSDSYYEEGMPSGGYRRLTAFILWPFPLSKKSLFLTMGLAGRIPQYCIQHGEILLFDEADRIIGGFGQEKRVKYRLIQSWKLEKEKSKCQRNVQKNLIGRLSNFFLTAST